MLMIREVIDGFDGWQYEKLLTDLMVDDTRSKTSGNKTNTRQNKLTAQQANKTRKTSGNKNEHTAKETNGTISKPGE